MTTIGASGNLITQGGGVASMSSERRRDALGECELDQAFSEFLSESRPVEPGACVASSSSDASEDKIQDWNLADKRGARSHFFELQRARTNIASCSVANGFANETYTAMLFVARNDAGLGIVQSNSGKLNVIDSMSQPGCLAASVDASGQLYNMSPTVRAKPPADSSFRGDGVLATKHPLLYLDAREEPEAATAAPTFGDPVVELSVLPAIELVCRKSDSSGDDFVDHRKFLAANQTSSIEDMQESIGLMGVQISTLNINGTRNVDDDFDGVSLNQQRALSSDNQIIYGASDFAGYATCVESPSMRHDYNLISARTVEVSATGKLPADGGAAVDLSNITVRESFSQLVMAPRSNAETAAQELTRSISNNIILSIADNETHLPPVGQASAVVAYIGDAIATEVGGMSAPSSETSVGTRPFDGEAFKAPNSYGIIRKFELQLKPENLGCVTIRLRLSGERLDVHIETAQSDIMNLINGDEAHLTHKLRAAGYVLDHLDVKTAVDGSVDVSVAGGVVQTNDAAAPQERPGAFSSDFPGNNNREHTSKLKMGKNQDDMEIESHESGGVGELYL